MKSKAKSIRLGLEQWAEIEYAAQLHGHGVNDEVKQRIVSQAIEMPATEPANMDKLFKECDTDA